MAAQVAAILALILGWEHVPALVALGQGLLWVVLLTAMLSAVDYYRRFHLATSQIAADSDFRKAQARRDERRRAG